MWTEIVGRLHLHPSAVLAVGVETLAMIVTCAFNWARGAKPDRIAAVIFMVGWIGFEVSLAASEWVTGNPRQQMVFSTIFDVGPALGFLYLSIRYDNLWLGAAAMAQGAQFALDALDHAVHERFGTTVPVILISGINLLNLVMMAAMIGSVVSERRWRRTAARTA